MQVIAKITPALCRAARGLLDMNQTELATGASVSKNVIVDFEKGRRNPTRNNLAAIQRVLEEAGVEFTNGDAPGVRLRKKSGNPRPEGDAICNEAPQQLPYFKGQLYLAFLVYLTSADFAVSKLV